MDRIDALNAFLASMGQPTFVFFGPQANCTLDLCPPQWSVYGYRPSLGANVFFMSMFFCAMIAHIIIGVRGRAWSFTACMVCGCLDAMLGYATRAWMFFDLWNFDAFMIQVVCITTAPVFYCAAIYIVLAKTIATFAPALSRFRPALLYWVFISSDLISLILQGAGGAVSVVSSGLSQTGVSITLAGLAFQVAMLVIFCTIYIEYITRYYRSGLAQQHAPTKQGARGMTFGARLKVFYASEVLAIAMILARCAFRVEELRDGYDGPLVQREDLFIGLEGVLTLVPAFMLCIGHPALIFNDAQMRQSSTGASSAEESHLEQ